MKLPNLTNPRVQLEMQLGFYWGILAGALGSWVFIMFFTSWQWYFKTLSTIGEIGIFGSILLAIYQIIVQRRQYIEMEKMMQGVNSQANQTLADKGVSYAG